MKFVRLALAGAVSSPTARAAFVPSLSHIRPLCVQNSPAITPSIFSSALHMSSSTSNDRVQGGSNLVNAGYILISAAEEVSLTSASPRLLRDAGECLVDIGQSWTNSWEAVTYAAMDGASFFVSLSQLQRRQDLAQAFKGAGGALSGISAIRGCEKVGPPRSVKKLMTLSRSLEMASNLVDEVELQQALREASASIDALVCEYDELLGSWQ
mmetsp:Transcript_26581/g.78621  ORF Transcript_26581/g.78621 Transcript_26581/m.78621 type:complete len:211 (-) Transcript_26581:100-732(-)